MASVGDRFYNEDVGYADMAEVPRRKPESKVKNILIGMALAVVAAAVLIILARGSLPEMTPEQIVQLDDYQGQQPPRHIFNLYSLKQEQQRLDGKKAELAPEGVNQPVDEAMLDGQSTTLAGKAVTASQQTISSAVADTGLKGGKSSEIQASLNSRAAISDEVGIPGRETSFPIVGSVEAEEVMASSKEDVVPQNASELTVLPVYTVGKNRVNLRSSPAFGSEVLDILAIGQAITVFDTIGDWTHVATNDGTGTTGYIHNTMLEVKDFRP